MVKHSNHTVIMEELHLYIQFMIILFRKFNTQVNKLHFHFDFRAYFSAQNSTCKYIRNFFYFLKIIQILLHKIKIQKRVFMVEFSEITVWENFIREGGMHMAESITFEGIE